MQKKYCKVENTGSKKEVHSTHLMGCQRMWRTMGFGEDLGGV